MSRRARVLAHVPGPRFHFDHLFARRRLSAYVDDELAPDERRRVRRHVADCPDCGHAERSLRAVLRRLRGLAGRKPHGLAASSIERVREAERRRGREVGGR